MSYLLNGVNITRPKDFKRNPLFIGGDAEMLDGTTKRDIVSRKESFVLSWELMSRSTFDAILAIIELNTPVTFQVDDGNLSIGSTSVLTRISNVDYSTPGSSYLASVSIELIEVA